MVDVSLVSEAAWCEARRRAEVRSGCSCRALTGPVILFRPPRQHSGCQSSRPTRSCGAAREAGADLTSRRPWHLKWRSGQAPRGTGE